MKAKPKAKRPVKAEAAPLFNEKTKCAWLRLIRTPYIGNVTFWGLLAHFGSAEAALEALPEFARQGGRISSRDIPTEALIEAELEKAEAAGMTLTAAGEAGYPPLLACVEVPPPLLYVKGDTAIWNRPPIAVVGSRQASAAGLKFAAVISAALGREGFVIVSGLARGIDAAAHRAALPHATCAVLPGGLDAIYPPEHVGLAAEIAQSGMLIGECPPGFTARAQDFPRRNRIIAGGSLGTLVVEAAERSGSLITARLASEQNREVFAVPGHPLEPRAAGTNKLIKEGATFTTSADDVLEALKPQLTARQRRAPAPPRIIEVLPPSAAADGNQVSSPDARAANRSSPDVTGSDAETILNLLSFSPIDVDEICRLTGQEVRHVNAALLSLDLAGRIERRGLRQVLLRP